MDKDLKQRVEKFKDGVIAIDLETTRELLAIVKDQQARIEKLEDVIRLSVAFLETTEKALEQLMARGSDAGKT